MSEDIKKYYEEVQELYNEQLENFHEMQMDVLKLFIKLIQSNEISQLGNNKIVFEKAIENCKENIERLQALKENDNFSKFSYEILVYQLEFLEFLLSSIRTRMYDLDKKKE
tara:strand:- start:110 stop:442 length:333 start_codon:yes stop_codon:yes gene_type:complete